MKAIDNSQCRECDRQGIKSQCFAVDVSKMETAIGIERFECEHCHARFALRRDTISGNVIGGNRGVHQAAWSGVGRKQ